VVRARTLLPTGRLIDLASVAGAFAVSMAAGAVIAFAGDPERQVKAIALAIGLAGVAVAIVRPAVALALVLGMAPFEFHVTIAGVHTGTNELLLIGLAVAVLPRIRLSAIPHTVRAGGLLLVVGSSIAAVHAQVPSEAIWGAVRWSAVVVLLFAAFAVLRDDARAVPIAARILGATGIAVALLALLQRHGLYAIVGPPYLSDRIDSTFGYYTVFAGFMAIVAVVCAGETVALLRERDPWWIFHGTGALTATVGVGVSLSRGAIFALCVGVAFAICTQALRAPRLVGLALVVGVLVVGGWTLTPHAARSTLVQRLETPSGGDVVRHALQQAGTRALREHPLGLGYGNFPSYLEAHVSDLRINQAYFHSHRTPVQIGLDAGWLGLAGYVLLLLAPLARAVTLGLTRRLTIRATAFTGALAAFVAQTWFDYLFYETSFLVFVAALVWAIWRATERHEVRA
jgi:hypothetical protein